VVDALDPMGAGWKAEVRGDVGGAAALPPASNALQRSAAALRRTMRCLAETRHAVEILARLQDSYPSIARHGDDEPAVAGGWQRVDGVILSGGELSRSSSSSRQPLIMRGARRSS
jgi:hypothetical protein